MKNRLFIYAAIFITIILGGWSASSMKMETDVNAYNLASSQAIAHYESFLEYLENDPGEYSIVILEKETGWNTLEDFLLLEEITDFWEAQPQIGSVSSIVNLAYPRRGIFLPLTEPFLDLNHRKRFEERLDSYPLFHDIFQKFLSENRKYTLIFLETASGIPPQSAESLKERNYAARGIDIHYLQYDLIQKELQSYTQKDTIVLGIISLILILAGFYLFTHSLKGLGLITLMVAFNISATFIAMYLLHISFTLHMITVPCIITVLSFTDIMHILYHQKKLRADHTTDEGLRRAIISAVNIPLLLTSLTNIVGFFMFLVLSDNIHLFNYSLVSILGVAIAYLSSRLIVIHLMNREMVYLKRDRFPLLHSAHRSTFQWLFVRRKWVLMVFLVANAVLITFVVSTFRIDHAGKAFSIADASITRGKDIMEMEFFGSKQAEIFVTTQKGMIWDETILGKIENIENRVEKLFAPLYISSPTLLVKRYHRYVSGGGPQAFYVPRILGPDYTNGLVKHITKLGGRGMISKQADKARIVFGFADGDLPHLRNKYTQLRRILAAENNSSVTFELTGTQYLSDEATHSFSHKILIGFGVSILFSSLVILFLLKSVKISLGLLLVNLCPIFIALAAILLQGISITPLTLFLLSVLLGVCIDDSIYLVTHRRLQQKETPILPIFITSMVLSLGFMSLSFSSFTWLQPFGWIFLIGISLAYFLDVFILTLLFRPTALGGTEKELLYKRHN